MTEGTRSVLFGCHSIVHPIYVARAWKSIYGAWPTPWELVCILLHDIGHVGLDYLSDADQKARHWVLGARIAGALFGRKGYDLIAGHTSASGGPVSKLKKPDKMSHLLIPIWFQRWYYKKEGFGGWSPEVFRDRIAKDIAAGDWRDNHEIYLDFAMESSKQ